MEKRIGTLLREQGITIISVITSLSITISTIALAITGVFEGAGGSPSKNDGVLNKWLNRLTGALKRLAGKAVEALPAIVGSFVGAI